MLIIDLRFLTGRYHATPWGRNVNEGAAEWPPSPYRLVRAIFDAWKRKRRGWPAEKVAPLLAALASEPPLISLPPANSAHTRAWLSSNRPDALNKQLIFDAFVVLSRESRVLMGWPGVELDGPALASLDELLGLLNYMGRSESWVAAGASSKTDTEFSDRIVWNCRPLDASHPASAPSAINQASSAHAINPQTIRPLADPAWEPVRVACPVPSEAFGASGRLPLWLDALAMSTSELHKAKRDAPRALRFITYSRPHPCFAVKPISRPASTHLAINGVLYSIQSKLLPNVATTIELSERVRGKLMGIHKRIAGGPQKLSRNFSGKDGRGHPAKGHHHSYYLPLDTDHDGRIDHLLIISQNPLDNSERVALDRLQSVWQPGGKPDLMFVPVKWGDLKSLLQPSKVFISATPFVPPRHFRKGRGGYFVWLKSEIIKEAQNHGLPSPEHIIPIAALPGRLRTIHWLEFGRNRKDDAVRPGFGFRLEFKEPVLGPFAIGYGAHFGLGLFVPVKEEP
jgi:CRISPR-associated protein Csb2